MRLGLVATLATAFAVASIVLWGWFAYQNSQSSKAGLAVATFATVFVVLLLTLTYELQPETGRREFAVTLTYDEGHRFLGPTIFWPRTRDRIFFEKSMAERKDVVDIVEADGLRKAAEDYVLASLVGFTFLNLGWYKEVRITKVGIDEFTNRVPDPVCTEVTKAALEGMLEATGTAFRDQKLWGAPSVCLPPGSSVAVGDRYVEVRSGVFTLRMDDGPAFYTNELGGGVTRVTTQVDVTWRINRAYGAYRHVKRYRAWLDHAVEATKDWFYDKNFEEP